MIIFYIITSLIIGALLFINTKLLINRLLVIAFIILQWAYSIYGFMHKNISDAAYFTPDALALLLLFTLSIICIPALLHSYDYIYKEHNTPRVRGIYYGSTVVLIMALTAAYLSSHIAVTWIFVELTTLCASALIFHRRNSGSIEATWKYVFMSSISLVFVFIGILFVSISLGKDHTISLQYSNLMKAAPTLNTFWLKAAFIFIFTGYSLKLGTVPMYNAGIDAKDKAPSPSAALFTTVMANVGFVGFFRFYLIIANSPVFHWANNLILFTAIVSVFVATVYMVRVKNIKRMLAYSSIEHMGIILLGIAAGGFGYYAAILHLVLHSFAKSSLFLQIGHIYKTFKTKNIYSIGNYYNYNTAGAVFLLLAFIFTVAMPPSGLFISEFYIFRALFEARYLFVLIIVFILLTTIIWAFGKNVFKILFTPPIGFDESKIEKVSTIETFSQYFLLGLVLYLGIAPPDIFVKLINEAIKTLCV